MTTHDLPRQARLAALRRAVKKTPFSVSEVRKDVPDASPCTVSGQIRRLTNEGVITRLAQGLYVATCVAHLDHDIGKQKPVDIPQADEIVAFLETPRRGSEIAAQFDLKTGTAWSRLNALVRQGRVHKHKFRKQQLYASSPAALKAAIAPPRRVPAPPRPQSPRFGVVSNIAATVMRYRSYA
jgi:DNA-binding HxlR family transcriptional regulator